MTRKAILAWGVMFELLNDRLRDPAMPGSTPLDPRIPGARELKEQFSYLQELLRDPERQDEARWQMIRLESLITDWDVVANAMPAFVAELRGRIMRDEQRSGYIGARAELALAARFLTRGVHLIRGPRAGSDFQVSRADGMVSIECTAAHLGIPRESTFEKIEERIRTKGEREYCGPGALLYVDYTAILYRGGDVLDPSVPGRAQVVVKDTCWGSVLLGALMVESVGSTYHHAFMRFDGADQTSALRGLLDEVVPIGETFLPPVSIPPTS